MRIHFLFVLHWLVPEMRGLPAAAAHDLIEAARQRSQPMIRQYAGWCFGIAMMIPPVVLVSAFAWSNLLASDYRILLSGLLALLCSLLTSLLMTWFYGLMLSPAIRRLLAAPGDTP